MILASLVILCTGLASYLAWPGLSRRLARRVRIGIQGGLALVTALTMMVFSVPWVFPLFLGTLVGCYLSVEIKS